MTLFYDASEARSTTNLPQDAIDYGYVWNSIERETGGDFIIAPEVCLTHKVILLCRKLTVSQVAKHLDLPIIDVVKMRAEEHDMDSVLFEYLYRGSLVVQRKSGSDLISSIQGPRLEESLSRMNKAVPFRSQRVLLYTGNFTEKDGLVLLDGSRTGLSYMAFVMALTAWSNRGGVAINLQRDTMILEWIKLVEKQLASYEHASTKDVYPSVYYPPDMPDDLDVLQMPIEVSDWRKTMVTFPGLGPDKINALKHKLESDLNRATLWNALQYATSPSIYKELKGWGPKSVENVRQWLEIPDNYELVLQPILKTGEPHE